MHFLQPYVNLVIVVVTILAVTRCSWLVSIWSLSRFKYGDGTRLFVEILGGLVVIAGCGFCASCGPLFLYLMHSIGVLTMDTAVARFLGVAGFSLSVILAFSAYLIGYIETEWGVPKFKQ